jgi:hypothetical protein
MRTTPLCWVPFFCLEVFLDVCYRPVLAKSLAPKWEQMTEQRSLSLGHSTSNFAPCTVHPLGRGLP